MTEFIGKQLGYQTFITYLLNTKSDKISLKYQNNFSNFQRMVKDKLTRVKSVNL